MVTIVTIGRNAIVLQKSYRRLRKLGVWAPNAIKVPNAADLWIVKKIRYHSPPIVLLVLK